MGWFNWSVAQGNTLEEVGDDIVEMLPDDMTEGQTGCALSELGYRLSLAGASSEEKQAIVERVRERLAR